MGASLTITLTEIDDQEPQPVLGGRALGYPCAFTSEIGGGPALLAGRGRPGTNLLGAPLEVELAPEAVEALRSPADEPDLAPGGGYRLEPLPGRPGDFRATGRIVSLVWLDDLQEDALLEVLIGPALFSFPAEGLGEAGLEWGGWLSFTLRRLVLEPRQPD